VSASPPLALEYNKYNFAEQKIIKLVCLLQNHAVVQFYILFIAIMAEPRWGSPYVVQYIIFDPRWCSPYVG